MKTPSIPNDEFPRWLALHRLGILDTPAEESLDRITRLVSAVLDVPICLISLVDSQRQWFKSCIGLDATETAREISFCGHAIFDRAPLVVRDAATDSRFADNPLVAGPPHIRAYMGIPLYPLDNQPIGTLCVIDTKPRNFNAEQIGTLCAFAHIVEDDIRAKANAAEKDAFLQYARTRDRTFRDAFEHSAHGMMHLGLNGRLLRANARACKMLGYPSGSMPRARGMELLHPEEADAMEQGLQDLLSGEISVVQARRRLKMRSGQYLTVNCQFSLKHGQDGEPDYAVALLEKEARKRQTAQA